MIFLMMQQKKAETTNNKDNNKDNNNNNYQVAFVTYDSQIEEFASSSSLTKRNQTLSTAPTARQRAKGKGQSCVTSTSSTSTSTSTRYQSVRVIQYTRTVFMSSICECSTIHVCSTRSRITDH